MTRALFAIACLALFGCAGASSEPISPGMWQVECRRSQGNCYREANKVCPKGFDVVDGAEKSGYIVSGNAIIPAFRGELIVRCHENFVTAKGK